MNVAKPSKVDLFLPDAERDEKRSTCGPRFVEQLQRPVLPLNGFSIETQEMLRCLIEYGELPCSKQDGELFVSWLDLNPYLPVGADV